jgi:hypothetical protein
MPLSFGVNQHPIAVEKQRFRPTKLRQYRTQDQNYILFLFNQQRHIPSIHQRPSQSHFLLRSMLVFLRTSQYSSRPQLPQFGIQSPISPRHREISS